MFQKSLPSSFSSSCIVFDLLLQDTGRKGCEVIPSATLQFVNNTLLVCLSLQFSSLLKMVVSGNLETQEAWNNYVLLHHSEKFWIAAKARCTYLDCIIVPLVAENCWEKVPNWKFRPQHFLKAQTCIGALQKDTLKISQPWKARVTYIRLPYHDISNIYLPHEKVT